ncbi:hypothetical protein ABT144_05910 [Streptomyces sp. NPDC002039]|uniref:hypothetical protein n=1 Tax=Streptomyces sp. NPDC002039 TaxID=3154660 RepID=UPI0033241CBE
MTAADRHATPHQATTGYVTGPDVAEGSDAELAERVFAGPERWGWEFVQPPEPDVHPDAHHPPVHTEPSDAEVRRLQEQVRGGRNTSGRGCVAVLIAIVVFALSKASLIATGVALALFTALVVASSPKARLGAARRRLEAGRRAALEHHHLQVRAWQDRIDAHRDARLRENERLDTWFPLALESGSSRIDVFGGTGNGWASLLATVGGPLLTAGHAVVVLDLTQQAVALELAGLAARRGVSVGHVPLPGALLGLDLRTEFTPEELAETFAEALGSMRPPGADVDLHTIDADLVQTVAGLLGGPVTFARLAAGLRVLLRVYDPAPDADPLLSPDEVEAVTQAVDLVGQSERVQNELRYVRAQVELLARAEQIDVPDAPAPDWWRPGGLTVLSTADLLHRRKDLADRFTFFRLLHALRRRTFAADGTLIVAGADHLGREALESMARQARVAGVRLILLLEHLREATVQVAGGSGSATVFMRMGNGEEAKAAAQFIGQEHTFLVNQLTRQLGDTVTEGRGTSYTYQRGVSDTDGVNRGGSSGWSGLSHNSGRSWGTSKSTTTSLSRSWQDSTNTSTARSTTHGENLSRVYEFTVEPTQLQSLPTTGLVLVEAGQRGRRVVFADCNPGITFLPRRAPQPRASLT